jgi:hypothetical protein
MSGNEFSRMINVCASPCCKANTQAGQDFCMDCAEGERWHQLKKTRESLGLMHGKTGVPLSVDCQEAIRENREKRKKKAVLAETCSPEQLQMHLDYINEGRG